MKKLTFIFILFSLFVFTTCDNSLNINAEWKERTVVYAIFDPGDSISYIRVTKAFLGEGNILAMAKERDSSEYKNISVTLEKYFNNSHTKTYVFEPTEIDGKEDGTFYNPYQTVYAAVTHNELDAIYTSDTTYTYKLQIINNSKDTVGKSMPLISNRFTLITPFTPSSSTPTITFSHSSINETRFEWYKVENGYIYNVSAEIEILETLSNKDSVMRIISWDNIFNFVNEDVDLIQKKIPSMGFFYMMLARVPHKDAEKENLVVKRQIRDFTLVFKIGTKDYYEYVTGLASSGLNMDFPVYSNFENGIGLITSRVTHTRKCILSDRTKAALIFEPSYEHLKF